MAIPNIYLFWPNIIGWGRVILGVASLFYMQREPITAMVLYWLSAFLDAFDGMAARHFDQSEAPPTCLREPPCVSLVPANLLLEPPPTCHCIPIHRVSLRDHRWLLCRSIRTSALTMPLPCGSTDMPWDGVEFATGVAAPTQARPSEQCWTWSLTVAQQCAYGLSWVPYILLTLWRSSW